MDEEFEPDEGDDADLDDEHERCPECGAHFEEDHAWDCSRFGDDADEEEEGPRRD
jgi:hypothetical protein